MSPVFTNNIRYKKNCNAKLKQLAVFACKWCKGSNKHAFAADLWISEVIK